MNELTNGLIHSFIWSQVVELILRLQVQFDVSLWAPIEQMNERLKLIDLFVRSFFVQCLLSLTNVLNKMLRKIK